MISRLLRIFELLLMDGAIHALITWPKFSLASYSIITRMQHAGVKPATVIDVGANVGQFAVAASRLFEDATVYPIEPDPKTVEILRQNVGVETAKNILNTAIGEDVGTAVLHVNSDSQVSSLLELGSDRVESYPNSTVVENITVQLNTLDALFLEAELQEPILLKIDAQGFEDKVVKGATQLLKRVSWVLIEVSFSELYEGEQDFGSILKLMQSTGFEFIRPVNFHTSPTTGDIIEMDALFGRAASVGVVGE